MLGKDKTLAFSITVNIDAKKKKLLKKISHARSIFT